MIHPPTYISLSHFDPMWHYKTKTPLGTKPKQKKNQFLHTYVVKEVGWLVPSLCSFNYNTSKATITPNKERGMIHIGSFSPKLIMYLPNKILFHNNRNKLPSGGKLFKHHEDIYSMEPGTWDKDKFTHCR